MRKSISRKENQEFVLEEAQMEPLAVILKRFMQLLPFLASPFGHRRFHFELFYRYPDIWNDRETASSSFAAPQIHEEQVASQEPAFPAASSCDASNPGHALASRPPVGRQARSHLSWMDLRHFGPHGGEPFW